MSCAGTGLRLQFPSQNKRGWWARAPVFDASFDYANNPADKREISRNGSVVPRTRVRRSETLSLTLPCITNS